MSEHEKGLTNRMARTLAAGALALLPAMVPLSTSAAREADGRAEATVTPLLERREIRFSNGGVELAGVILSTVGSAAGLSPGLVMIHGSGDADRGQAWASAFASALAEEGFVVLLPDKRGSGASGGDWRTASFTELADDAVAGVEALSRTPGVDPRRVGLLGLSQGGHVAPLAGHRSERVAFVVSVSASAVAITEQVVDEVEKLARRAGFTDEQVERVDRLHRLAIEYGLSGEGWEAYQRSLRRSLASDLAGHGVIEPFPRSRDHWVWRWVRAVGPYDPLPHWRALAVPSLVVYGALDTQIQVDESIELLLGLAPREDALRSLVVLGDAGHSLRESSTGAIRRDLLGFVHSWVQRTTSKD